MKKYVLRIYQAILAVIAVTAITLICLFCVNADEIITKNITLKYFEKSLNENNQDHLKEFTASSENDILYKNLVDVYSDYRDRTTDYKFKIDNVEEFGSGKYQCYFKYKINDITKKPIKVPTCDLEHEGRYMNYLLDTTTTYKDDNGDLQTKKEKGLVVFVKDGSNGNLFEWKLVRYNKYVKDESLQ